MLNIDVALLVWLAFDYLAVLLELAAFMSMPDFIV